MAFGSPVNITQHNAQAFLTTQDFFIRALYAQLADVIATCIIRVGVYFFLIHLTDIAQNMRSKRICITTYAALLYGKAVETEKLFTKEGEFASRNLRHKDLWCISGITGILLRIFYFLATLFVKLRRDSYSATKV